MSTKIAIIDRNYGDRRARTMWTDHDGNSHVMSSNRDGSRTETIITPQGKVYRLCRGRRFSNWSLARLKLEFQLSRCKVAEALCPVS